VAKKEDRISGQSELTWEIVTDLVHERRESGADLRVVRWREQMRRAIVPGGWLVETVHRREVEGPAPDDLKFAVALTFVPDPLHEWTLGKKPTRSPYRGPMP